MKKYFYTDGTTQFGPFTFEELREQYITRDTKVWFEGLAEWKSGGSIPELSELFKLTPPEVKTTASFQQIPNTNYSRPIPKTWLVESILVTLFCCLPFGIAGIVNASKVESKYNMGDYEGALNASNEASKWTRIAFWIGVAGGIIYLILWLIGIASIGSNS
jgi:hypothetical protein